VIEEWGNSLKDIPNRPHGGKPGVDGQEGVINGCWSKNTEERQYD